MNRIRTPGGWGSLSKGEQNSGIREGESHEGAWRNEGHVLDSEPEKEGDFQTFFLEIWLHMTGVGTRFCRQRMEIITSILSPFFFLFSFFTLDSFFPRDLSSDRGFASANSTLSHKMISPFPLFSQLFFPKISFVFPFDLTKKAWRVAVVWFVLLYLGWLGPHTATMTFFKIKPCALHVLTTKLKQAHHRLRGVILTRDTSKQVLEHEQNGFRTVDLGHIYQIPPS
ncbi:hypothetical protein EV126DRAFT_25062 [Verticillium dahliae]|nr:hypothetical protein EV126DRAFT_25062 [Verticillium dahliae]